MDTIKFLQDKYNILIKAYSYKADSKMDREWLAIRKQEDEMVYLTNDLRLSHTALLKADSVKITPEMCIDISNAWANIFKQGWNYQLVARAEWKKETDRFNDMVKRCYKETNKDYKYYGACGVTICNEWLNDNFAYRVFAISNGSIGNSIDRINPKGNYEPRNVKFVDWKTNVVENKINVSEYPPKPRYFKGIGRIYQQDYERKVLKSSNPGLIRDRIRANGWTLFEALNVKVDAHKRYNRRSFWEDIENGSIIPLWEIFLTPNDERAVYFDKIGDVIECPYCKEKAMTLTPDYKVSCKCGFELKLKSV